MRGQWRGGTRYLSEGAQGRPPLRVNSCAETRGGQEVTHSALQARMFQPEGTARAEAQRQGHA